MPDHVHMMISIPPKYAVSQVVGYIKGKSAIHLARVYGRQEAQLGALVDERLEFESLLMTNMSSWRARKIRGLGGARSNLPSW